MNDVYDSPKYYEIAFSFRDISAEVDLFEECFRRFSRIALKSALELGCGPCPHMEELLKRGYQYAGLDLNYAMLEYSRKKAARLGLSVDLLQGNMLDFHLPKTYDFVYVLLGSLYAKSQAELLAHFASVAHALNAGGLYLLDWCIQFEQPWHTAQEDSIWEMVRDGVRVETSVSWKPVSLVEQTFEETIVLHVDDRGEKRDLVSSEVRRAIYPQEFLLLIESQKEFEFVGWWNNWDLNQPLAGAEKISRPIVVVRRK